MLSGETMKPSAELLALCRAYLEIVDSGDEARQGDERTAAHETMMDAMEREGIPFNSRYEARWIARYLVSENTLEQDFTPRLMWADEMYFRGDVLRHTPPNDNKAGLVPVMVIVLPFVFQPHNAERNHE